MEAIIEEIAKEVSVYIAVGTLIKDISKHDDYEVKKVERAIVILEHKPFLRAEKKDDLSIGYDELVHAFSKGRFYINGFSKIVENGYEHDLNKLKRAVKDTVEKIRSEEERADFVKVSAQKSELELAKAQVEQEKEEALKEKALIERDKLKVMDEKESLVQKRKSKFRSKLTRQEEEVAREEFKKQEEARLKKEREENERVESERKMVRDHKIKILMKKKSSQQQRFRLLKKQIN
jgi:hypothetical protein